MKKELSPEAQRALRRLKTDEIEAIQKSNPFRNERNEAIYSLRKLGLKHSILSEITGISLTQMKKICPGKRREEQKQLGALQAGIGPLTEEIIALREAIEESLKNR